MQNRLLKKAFQHGSLLSADRPEYRKFLLEFFRWQMAGDLGSGDLTLASLFPKGDYSADAVIAANAPGILAGLEEALALCKSQGIAAHSLVLEGKKAAEGSVIMELHGSVKKILESERLLLDIVGRMSGIASATQSFVEKAAACGETAISATRKTLWGLLDKRAVFIGGGLTHRLGLWHAIMVKDNHFSALRIAGSPNPFSDAVNRTTTYFQNMNTSEPAFFEMEVESFEEGVEVVNAFQGKIDEKIPAAILLDNFSPEDVKRFIQYLEKEKLREKILVEVSGGISEENVEVYAGAGADLISSGSLTHSSVMLDCSLRVIVP